MPRPYNFFQFSSGIVGSGLISNYPNNFSGKFFPDGSYSGVFTPEGLYNTPKAYLFGIEDNLFTPANISIVATGEQSSTNLHLVSISYRVSGDFFPVISESGSISGSFEGMTSGDNIDSTTFLNTVTGQVANDGIDNPRYEVILTGEFPRPYIDISAISNIITGEVTPQFFDSPITSLILSGNIVRYERDKSTVEFGIESISWTRGSIRVLENGTDVNHLNFSMEYIGWSQLN